MPPLGSPPHVLLVEGQDDKHVVKHVCRKNPSMPDFCIVEKGSVEQVLASIVAESMVPGRKSTRHHGRRKRSSFESLEGGGGQTSESGDKDPYGS